MYEAQLADVYDLIYEGRGKDYPAECAELVDLARARRAGADSLLDVACGTGAHLQLLRKEFSTVEGVELSDDMLAIATARLPGVPLHHGDMRSFSLAHRFDVVTCLFSSIGYMRSVADLHSAVGRMAEHLNTGGVLLVEPWYFPDDFLPGCVTSSLSKSAGQTVARISSSSRDGMAVPIQVHYLVADSTSGVRHFTDTHEMRLFTRAEYESAFTSAGCGVEYVRDRGFPCGMFVGVRK